MNTLFQASPSGFCSGICLVKQGGFTATIVVVPKMWFDGPRHHRVEWLDGQKNLNVVLGELDTCEVFGSEEGVNAFKSYFDNGQKNDRQLLVPIGANAKLTVEVAADDFGLDIETAVKGLDALSLVSGQGSILKIVNETWASANFPSFFRPLLMRDFVRQVETALQNSRRGYVWEDEVSGVVRGRVDPTSLAVGEITGWPIVRCRFEDFTADTPLLQVISAALTIACAYKSTNKIWSSFEGNTRSRGISLKRRMSEVTTINRFVALKKLSLLKVNRLDNSWLPALDLARHLLKEDDGLSSDAGESSAFEMRLDTSRVWERVLIDLLEMAQVSKLIDLNSQGPIPIKFMRPWNGLGNIIDSPRPDIIFQVSDKWWIFDAKYRRNNSGVPEMSEQYQMFAYSHLIENLNIKELALVYPTKSQSRKPLGPYGRNDSNDIRLSIGYVPFPSVHDLFSSWENYLEKNVGELNRIFASS